MKQARWVLLSATLLLTLNLTLGASGLAAQQPGKDRSLYERLGGYDAIAAVTDDFLGRLVADKQLQRFFTGFSDDSKQRIRQHTVDFLCKATGGPCVYHGRDMKTSHAGSGITQADWDISVKHLEATLDKFKVHGAERAEVLEAIAATRADIVEKK